MEAGTKPASKKPYQPPTFQIYGGLSEMTKKHNSPMSDHGNNRMTA